MTDDEVRGETHGCIVCGRPYQLYVVYNPEGKFIDMKVMSPGGKRVEDPRRPLVACESHNEEQIAAAVLRVYGSETEEE